VSATLKYANVEFYRGLAILVVVLYHFHDLLPFGYVGVDLFFVISGFLVSKPLIAQFCHDDAIDTRGFWIRRAYKILPSYYFYLLVAFGTLWLLGLKVDKQVFTWSYISRFVFIFRNYLNGPFCFALDHIWSLCIEVHFYLLLPIAFRIVKRKRNENVDFLIKLCLCAMLGTYLVKLVSIQSGIAEGQATTHHRMDALLWGVLLSLLEYQKGWFYHRFFQRAWMAWAGAFVVVSVWFAKCNYSLPLVWEHSLYPIGFAMLLAGSIHRQFKHTGWVKLMAKYSYNWYLWHPLMFVVQVNYIPNQWLFFLVYVVSSFGMAVTSTHFIEYYFYSMKEKVLVGKKQKVV